ncbi:MAG: alpha-E domain-containing protein, partial [Xanthomonadales bacterium]|nr:alpha-E domain-containing protein [Xanthomonadales bacterium]
GILAGTMSHGPAYQFIRLGRSIERADMTTRLIDVAAAILMTGREELKLHENGIWRAILRALSAYQMYQQYVRRRISGPDVVSFLLLDVQFPRAVGDCVRILDDAAFTLPRHERAREHIREIRSSLQAVDAEALDADAIHRYVDELQLKLAGLNRAIFDTWLNPMAVGSGQAQQ